MGRRTVGASLTLVGDMVDSANRGNLGAGAMRLA